MAHPSFGTTGGAELLAARHAEYLRSAGHEVRLVTTALDRERWPRLAAEVDVRIVGRKWSDPLGLPARAQAVRSLVARQAAQLRGADVVLGENYPGNVVAARTPGASRRVWYCNEPSRRLHPRPAYPTLSARVDATAPADDTRLLAAARRVLRRRPSLRAIAERGQDVAAVARLDCVIGDSRFSAELVRLTFGRTADAVVYPTVPVVETPRRPNGMSREGLRVLVHTRLEVWKNVEMVLRGFAEFRARHPGEHELHVVGQGREETPLRELARELAIDGVTRFHGFLDLPTLEQVYARCDVMSLLPPDEPFGMVFPEAAQRGLLLIGPDHGGPVEILDGGALGWTVDIFRPEPLADALLQAWRLPDAEVTRRRERAAAACRERYGPQATLPALLALLTA